MTLQANLIGSIILTSMLVEKMEIEGRIVNVSSKGHYKAVLDLEFIENDMNFDKLKEIYKSFKVYMITKLGQIYFTKTFSNYCISRNYKVKNVSVHPGLVFSSMFESFNSNIFFCIFYYVFSPVFWYFTKTCLMGAQTTLKVCYVSYEELVDGAYYHDCETRISSLLIRLFSFAIVLNSSNFRKLLNTFLFL